MGAGDGVRRLRAKRAAKGKQASRMVAVVVTQDDFLDVCEIQTELLCVLKDGVGPRAGVEEDAASVGFDQCGEAPLADPIVRKHRGEDGHFERLDDARLALSGG